MDLYDKTNMNPNKKTLPVGGYTSSLRYISEPCSINTKKADLENMEMLGFSRLNPFYLFARIKQYFSTKRNKNKH